MTQPPLDFRPMSLRRPLMPGEPSEYALLPALKGHRIGRLLPEEVQPGQIPLLVAVTPAAGEYQISEAVAAVRRRVVCMGISLAAHQPDVAIGAP